MKSLNSKVVLAACAVLAFAPSTYAASWTAPIGVPSPSFGINETAPAVPATWTTAVAGFYYVDATKSTATDTSNPYGTPAKPRRTIPTALPAGSVVELHGTYDASHESPRIIVASGTATSPVFIRGVSPTARPLVRNLWQVSGTYLVIENLEFGPLDGVTTGALVVRAPGHHISIRNSDLHGNLNGGGMGLESWDGSSTLQNVVVYNNSVHDNGDVHATYDQDVHGIHIGERVSSAWVVDNQMARNSGDGIQINAGSAALQPATHHIYVSRNTAFNNKQTGIWVKQATDVIISQNRCYGHRPSDSSYGQCMGYQYATERVWFIANHIEDSEVGIGVSSDNNLGTGTQSYFIGNVIHNIHHSEAGYNPGSAWSSSAIMLAGGIDRRVVNNTIYDVDAGVNVPEPGYGSLEITNNIIAKVAAGASNHVFIEDSALAARTVLRHNLLEGDARMRLGGSQQHLTAAQLATSGSLNADPKLANPGADDFHLLAGSPAIDAGETHAVYAAFQQRYGISIANAADGVARPQGSAYDDGAYEGGSSSCAANSVPGAPSNLTALVQSSTVTLSWIKPTTCAAPTSYVIEVGTAAGQANLATGSTGSTSTTFVGTGWPGGVYFVRVRAQNGSGSSSPSNETQAAVGGVPSAPINVTASAAGSRVTIAWAMPTVGPAATSYVVEIGSGAGLSDLAKVPVTATSIVSAGAVSGRYYVRVRAKNASGQSWPSTDAVLVVP